MTTDTTTKTLSYTEAKLAINTVLADYGFIARDTRDEPTAGMAQKALISGNTLYVSLSYVSLRGYGIMGCYNNGTSNLLFGVHGFVAKDATKQQITQVVYQWLRDVTQAIGPI